MNIKNVCIIGAGIMGSGISQLLASHNINVNLVDISDDILIKVKNSMEKNLQRFYVDKGKISKEDAERILGRIKLFVDQYEAIKDVQMVIEAIFEDMETKQNLFANLDAQCDKNVILASNTSSLSITDMASKSSNQERIIGIHFFNPAPVMKLIELIKGKKTSNEIVEKSKIFSEGLDKTVVIVNDTPGFVTTRLIYVLCNEAINLLSQGIASAKDIDTACKLAFNFPMGPLELSDLVGNDIYEHIGRYLEKELGKSYQPSPLLQKMAREELLGRKTGKGFYKY